MSCREHDTDSDTPMLPPLLQQDDDIALQELYAELDNAIEYDQERRERFTPRDLTQGGLS
jgi:hypothetical protein